MANLSILRNPAFESGLHGSPKLFSGFSGRKLLSDLRFCIRKSARARICRHVLKRVIDRPNIYFPRGRRPTMKVSADLCNRKLQQFVTNVELRRSFNITLCVQQISRNSPIFLFFNSYVTRYITCSTQRFVVMI